jgi:hypothetical protein
MMMVEDKICQQDIYDNPFHLNKYDESSPLQSNLTCQKARYQNNNRFMFP